MLGDENQWEKAPLFKLMLTLVSGYTAGVRYERPNLSTTKLYELWFSSQGACWAHV